MSLRILKNIAIILTIFTAIYGQDYDVKIWGINIGEATLEQLSENEVSLTIKANDLINNYYPLELDLNSKYNWNYSVIESNKNVKQGRDKYQYSSKHYNNVVIYDEKDSIETKIYTHSFLSLLVRVINSPINDVDTKWFNFENEGIIYEARPLWNDTTLVNIGNEEYLCDHYRIDLKIVDETKKLFNETDYFNELFFDINSIRQIWVETWQKQRKLVKIEVKNSLVNLSIVIKN